VLGHVFLHHARKNRPSWPVLLVQILATALSRKGMRCGKETLMSLKHRSARGASIRLSRVVFHLLRARRELIAAKDSALDRYHQQQLHQLIFDLRELSSPLGGIAESLEQEGERR